MELNNKTSSDYVEKYILLPMLKQFLSIQENTDLAGNPVSVMNWPLFTTESSTQIYDIP